MAMLTIRQVTIGGVIRWYLCHSRENLDAPLILGDDARISGFSALGKCEFYSLGSGALIAKIKIDKYSVSSRPLKWFGRFIQERLLLQVDARREYAGSMIYRRAGLSVVEACAWCVALNPLNPRGSIFISRYLGDLVPGREYFDSSSEIARKKLIDDICHGAVSLANQGYYSRDPHLNNLLVGPTGEICWLDTRLSSLPGRRSEGVRLVISAQVSKIPGSEYQAYARNLLEHRLRAQPVRPPDE